MHCMKNDRAMALWNKVTTVSGPIIAAKQEHCFDLLGLKDDFDVSSE